MSNVSGRKRRHRKLAAGAAVAIGAVVAPEAAAAVISVDSAADVVAVDSECTLREAIINANDDAATNADCAAGDGLNDTIDFAGLTLPATITLAGTSMDITDDLTISGPGETDLIIDADGLSRIFNIADGNPLLFDVTISNLTLTNAFDSPEISSDGGAIHTEENLTLNSVTLTENLSIVSGGAVGAVGSAGVPVTLTITDSTITDNLAGCCGGGISGDYTILDVSNSVISGNYAVSNGGGIVLYALYGATIDETTISGNYASNGGGLYFYGGPGDVTIEDSTISGNYAFGKGGGVFLNHLNGVVTIRDTTVSGNYAFSGSGGLYLYDVSDATLERVRVIDNDASTYVGGAGVWGSTVSIVDSEVSGNTAEQTGGLYAGYGATLTLRNSTVAYNVATGVEGAAGGVNINSSTAYIELSTISHNEGSDAGNVFSYASSLDINSTIIANGIGSTEPDLKTESSTVTVDYSLIEDPTGASFTGANNITGQDPLLGPLQNNGGTTLTMKPAVTSPVVNTGDPALATPPFDQRGPGFPRVAGGRVDMGAVELQPGTLSLSATAYPASEGAPFVTITVNRTGGSDGAVSVNYTTAPGTAAAGADYTTTAGTLNWADGDTAPKTFDVPILEDVIFEGSETFNVTLNTPGGGAALGTSAAVVTIADNDTQPTILINDLNQLEGTSFNFNVTLSNPSVQTVTVNFTTAGVSATSGVDFTPNGGTLTFNPLVTSQPVTVNTIQDPADEPSETFNVALSTPSNAAIADATGVGTITDDDGPPAITIDNVTLAEGNAGTTAFTFNVTLAPASGQTVTVDFTTQDGTAVAPGDYTANAGTLTFVPGDTSEPITVLVNGDTTIEATETFNVVLSNAPLAAIDDNTGIGTITNDDVALVSDLGVTKSLVGTGPFFVGQNATFNINVTNAGPDAAPSVTITDTLPAGMTLVSASPSCTGTTAITCTIGSLAANGNATVTLTVQLTQAGTLNNTAAASPAGATDPTPATGGAAVVVEPTPANAVVPTLSEWMLIALASALAAIAAMKVKR